MLHASDDLALLAFGSMFVTSSTLAGSLITITNLTFTSSRSSSSSGSISSHSRGRSNHNGKRRRGLLPPPRCSRHLVLVITIINHFTNNSCNPCFFCRIVVTIFFVAFSGCFLTIDTVTRSNFYWWYNFNRGDCLIIYIT